MAIYDGDQQTGTALVLNGVHVNAGAAAVKAAAPANSTYTFTATFTFQFNGQHLTYRRGVSYVLDPALKAALIAKSAPMVAA